VLLMEEDISYNIVMLRVLILNLINP
jgi:hypothetical protein